MPVVLSAHNIPRPINRFELPETVATIADYRAAGFELRPDLRGFAADFGGSA